ncbi:MAG TPA: sigma-70 family RNA polymerase sigma factor [Terracidiphilus sp.]|nr:sigma-70 family RNA polymerase sigma factor [Terracidiphilus sp.]
MLIVIELSDEEIVVRIGAGKDPDAEAEFCRRMGPRIRLYGLRHLRDQQAADDLMQQVLMTTLLALRECRLRETEKLASFVLGTCRMMVLDQRRNVRRREQLMEAWGADLPPTVIFATPRLDQDNLARCVQSLKERERAVVILTFYDEEAGPDAARMLGVTEANVRVIRHRALHQLRECMGVRR